MPSPLVAIIMGSDSDLEIMKDAALVLEEMHIPYEIHILSAHRTPFQAMQYAQEASSKGIEVIIAGAGAAAHLAGVIAAVTELPVIGVPTKSSYLQGLDSLLSMVQMPGGIPVATVAINQAKNAGLLAVSILGIKYPEYREAYKTYKKKLEEEVLAKDKKLTTKGWQAYLEEKKK
ncbi:5-(carboxyamino)imidazole ribonucleotide mutase [Thermospira aquatica]|uniref:N5-carboxyaminoimidazole ribonucleotide mutase n=1 Tax=Thermospira aquatica TaxID=2828656 RepID=A0AAX3BDL4_9SPIR|nr:5-(carboxyamino)imidazole ribonucleotide mutase [Thermospira aquatica]URA10233.1 5-(carboxyamino)imidazole ribonucleotide mutase [Thermospira aquatica]